MHSYLGSYGRNGLIEGFEPGSLQYPHDLYYNLLWNNQNARMHATPNCSLAIRLFTGAALRVSYCQVSRDENVANRELFNLASDLIIFTQN